MAIDTRRFFNPSQPQTLQVSVWLLYFNAFWALLSALSGFPLSFLAVAACAGSAYGIANEKRWGYRLGVAVAVLDLALLVWAAGGLTEVLRIANLIPLMFAVALVVALLHPMSRDYQRIWFR
jgi:hypothetical protein